MDRDEIIRKTLIKLSKDKDAGVKEWLMGLSLMIGSMFGNIDKAVASAKDMDKFLETLEKRIETKSKGNIQVENKFKPIRNIKGDPGAGAGDFTIYFGEAYIINGSYEGLGENIKDYDVKIKVNPRSNKEERKKWKDTALRSFKTLKDVTPILLEQK